MDEPASRANGVRRRMQETRNQLDRNVGGLVRDARQVVDWRRNVKRHPWLAVGAAAAVGFLLMPKRRKSTHVDAETLAELARSGRLVVRVEGEPEKPPATVTGTLAATLFAIVGREAGTWLKKQAMGFVNAEMARRSDSRPRNPESESE